MKEQIEEMASIMCRQYNDGKCLVYGKCEDNCSFREDYKRLYNAGYRKQEWISVDERLPETNEEVLVYSSVGKIYTACYIRVDGIEFWFENIDGFREITHWMPLPPPPKENKND